MLESIDGTSVPKSVKDDFIRIINNYDVQTQTGRIYIERAFKFITGLKLIELGKYLPYIFKKDDGFLLFESYLDKIKTLFIDSDTEKHSDTWQILKEFMNNKIAESENNAKSENSSQYRNILRERIEMWKNFVEEIDALVK